MMSTNASLNSLATGLLLCLLFLTTPAHSDDAQLFTLQQQPDSGAYVAVGTIDGEPVELPCTINTSEGSVGGIVECLHPQTGQPVQVRESDDEETANEDSATHTTDFPIEKASERKRRSPTFWMVLTLGVVGLAVGTLVWFQKKASQRNGNDSKPETANYLTTIHRDEETFVPVDLE